jgi:dGTPase
VAQIAKSIAMLLNESQPARLRIDEDICECAGLAHDLGHPPFGHTGEAALDHAMASYGGFEGNAQTLRLLARIEKKKVKPLNNDDESDYMVDENGIDSRKGLNLTYRTLASILKYDKRIPTSISERRYTNSNNETQFIGDLEYRGSGLIKDKHGNDVGKLKLDKGYYSSEANLVERVKDAVYGTAPGNESKTIECQIMDLADDIAYSTYDLEDAFKAQFIQPTDLVFAPDPLLEDIAHKMGDRINKTEVRTILARTFVEVFHLSGEELESNAVFEKSAVELVEYAQYVYDQSKDIVDNGYRRIEVTSQLVDRFIRDVKLIWNPDEPVFSAVEINDVTRNQIEVLKHFTYIKLIQSSMMRVAEYRGYEIVSTLFCTLIGRPELLPEDQRAIYERVGDDSKPRVVCDFVAGMTDRYAIEFFGRLHSDKPESIFKPL